MHDTHLGVSKEINEGVEGIDLGGHLGNIAANIAERVEIDKERVALRRRFEDIRRRSRTFE